MAEEEKLLPPTPEEIADNEARIAAEREKLIATLLANPEDALVALDKADAEDSLLVFIRQHWHILEPGTEFVEGWAVAALCKHLEAVTRGDILRLNVNIPPGFMKSLTLNVFWPAWEWGPKAMPWYRYVTAAYSEDLTFRDNRKLVSLIESEEYQRKWGHVFKLVKTGEALVTNDKTGFSRATSVSGVGTGERGDRFKMDDAHNIKDIPSDVKRESTLQWAAESVPTRINSPAKSAIINIGQRVHERDVGQMCIDLGFISFIIAMEYEPEHKCITYLSKEDQANGKIFFEDPRTVEGTLAWPERYPKDYLEDTLKPMLMYQGGDYAVVAQLQQRPTPRGGAMFKRDWFPPERILKSIPEPVVRRRRAWDLAGSTRKRSARTSTTRMCKGQSGAVFVEHNAAFRKSPYGVEEQVKLWAQSDADSQSHSKTIIPQDPAQAGKAQVKQYAGGPLAGFDFAFVNEGSEGDKEARARPFAAQCEAGNVYLIEGPWIKEWLDEMCSFPVGRYRDRVDSTSLAYLSLVERVKEVPPTSGGELHMPEEDLEDSGFD